MTMPLQDPAHTPEETLSPHHVERALSRIRPFIRHTPVLESATLNEWLGHRVLFKAECFQKIGAFKARGAINALLALEEEGNLPSHIVAYSSGNHAQAAAWAGAMKNIPTTIYLPKFVSAVKKQATRSYGAKVIETATRQEAEDRVKEAALKGGVVIPPFDHDEVIAGQGTACLEALKDGIRPQAIFAPCGGGGLCSGSYLAAQLLAPEAQVFAAEPALANDAAISLRQGSIYRFADSPATIADGARTLSLSPRTFHWLQKLQGVFEVQEEDIIYWTQWLSHLLKCACEPTSALAMAAAFEWLKDKNKPQTVLIILSGGNLSAETRQGIWQKDYLAEVPCMKSCKV
jgi:threonine dehydratase